MDRETLSESIVERVFFLCLVFVVASIYVFGLILANKCHP